MTGLYKAKGHVPFVSHKGFTAIQQLRVGLADCGLMDEGDQLNAVSSSTLT
jgi:hypothetical protein